MIELKNNFTYIDFVLKGQEGNHYIICMTSFIFEKCFCKNHF